ncbi:MAG: SpoIIE family protein phosphatase [Atopobiaceae bacterium]|nr:SpoIIE family protein phosphatase [Atopobiaceae bacterium]
MLSSESIAIIVQFAIATLLPVLAGAVLTKLEKRPLLANRSYPQRQVIIGVIFGAIAIYGTEFGIKTDDAVMNVRDAAPIVAGLFFGGPAGIIAGIIGGVERWFSVLWGTGMFTRLACTLGTIFAGFYAAALRRYVLDERKPSWPISLAIGMVVEVLHLLLVFITNMGESTRAFRVVQACSWPMISCVGISVALSSAVIAFISGQKLPHREETRGISQVIQIDMLAVVVIGFVASLGFTYVLQNNTVYSNAMDTLALELHDAQEDIQDASNANLLELTRRAAEAIPSVDVATQEVIDALVSVLDVSEIHVVDARGIIVASSKSEYLGFDMGSGSQSREFLVLLPGGRSNSYVQDFQPISMDGSRWRKYAGVRIEGGFVQVGYDSERFLVDIASKVEATVANRHVGHGGMLLVFTEDGSCVGMRSDVFVSQREGQEIYADSNACEPNEMFTTALHNAPYFAMHQDAESLRVVAMLPIAEADQSRDLAVLVTSFMEVVIFAALFAAIYILIKNVVVSSIWQVNGTLDKITSGDLEAQVNVRGSTEFASLSDDINRTVGALREAIAAESARIENDLATAKAIQESSLPRTFPPFPDIDAFDIYASMNAAREVGGDFYDFFLVDDHTLCFLIADVSGKGIPASLFMMAAKSELGNYIQSGMALSEAVRSANRSLCMHNEAGMFVTVWAATLDYKTGLLTYVNAGHNPPLIRHNGTWQWLKRRNGLFLGTFETAQYTSATLDLVPGDQILLYTDGVNEAFSVDEEEYGNDRLEAFLSKHTDLHPRILVEMLKADVRRWAHGAEQSDDITALCLEYGVPPEVSGSFTVEATPEALGDLKHRLHFELSQMQCPAQTQRQIDLVVEELFTNIYQHSYANLEKPGKVLVEYLYNSNPSSITIGLSDWGPAFNPLEYQKGEEGDEVTGMGIGLVLTYVDDMSYVRYDDRNIVAFHKNW